MAVTACHTLRHEVTQSSVLSPQAAGLRESPYDDEGVYALAAQLLAQNKHPYRDYIYAHPPLGPLFLLPGVEYRFTAWGSPTSFIDLRYLMLAYSALTVGLAALIAWRLWGLDGGLLTGALLALDPASVWTGRHVMLEAPLLFLAALAALLYVLARDHEPAPGALLVGAGFCAALAGGVKLPGFLLLAAIALDLLARRRWGQLGLIATGAAIVWLPLLVYLAVLRGGEPLNQFVWFQALRPPD